MPRRLVVAASQAFFFRELRFVSFFSPITCSDSFNSLPGVSRGVPLPRCSIILFQHEVLRPCRLRHRRWRFRACSALVKKASFVLTELLWSRTSLPTFHCLHMPAQVSCVAVQSLRQRFSFAETHRGAVRRFNFAHRRLPSAFGHMRSQFRAQRSRGLIQAVAAPPSVELPGFMRDWILTHGEDGPAKGEVNVVALFLTGHYNFVTYEAFNPVISAAPRNSPSPTAAYECQSRSHQRFLLLAHPQPCDINRKHQDKASARRSPADAGPARPGVLRELRFHGIFGPPRQSSQPLFAGSFRLDSRYTSTAKNPARQHHGNQSDHIATHFIARSSLRPPFRRSAVSASLLNTHNCIGLFPPKRQGRNPIRKRGYWMSLTCISESMAAPDTGWANPSGAVLNAQQPENRRPPLQFISYA